MPAHAEHTALQLCDATVKAASTDRRITLTLSSDTPDRSGDVVRQSGISLVDWVRSGCPIMFAHDYSQPPIARGLPETFRTAGGKSYVDAVFPPEGAYAFADSCYELIKAGILSNASIGFSPTDARPNATGGQDYRGVNLIEASIVPIPANTDCHVSARVKAQMRTWATRVLKGTSPGVPVTMEPSGHISCPRRASGQGGCPQRPYEFSCDRATGSQHDCPVFEHFEGAVRPIGWASGPINPAPAPSQPASNFPQAQPPTWTHDVRSFRHARPQDIVLDLVDKPRRTTSIPDKWQRLWSERSTPLCVSWSSASSRANCASVAGGWTKVNA